MLSCRDPRIVLSKQKRRRDPGDQKAIREKGRLEVCRRPEGIRTGRTTAQPESNTSPYGEKTMAIEIRLRQVLKEHGLHKHGVETEIARYCGIHRHSVGNLLRNNMSNPSLSVLEKVCNWLIDNGVRAEKLPMALFGFRPPTLWRAVGGSETIALYLGMYVHTDTAFPALPAPMSVARYDAEVAAAIMNTFASRAEMGSVQTRVRLEFVPFHFSPSKPEINENILAADKTQTLRTFEKMRGEMTRENAILLGSQRVNYLLEFMVADLFGCEPFQSPRKKASVPFYLLYRKTDQPLPSCFGGRESQPWLKDGNRSGTYYLNDKEKWTLIEWKETKQDAGIVIIVRDGDSVQMAVFGFSGRATNALGRSLINESHKFWPAIEDVGPKEEKKEDNKKEGAKKGKGGKKTKAKEAKSKKGTGPFMRTKRGKEVAAYICRVTFIENEAESESGDESDSDETQSHKKDTVKVTALSKSVLEKYLD
jgi:transcriptional regulator with XRE-family HTH domain